MKLNQELEEMLPDRPQQLHKLSLINAALLNKINYDIIINSLKGNLTIQDTSKDHF